MKVLIISHNPICTNNNMGKTLFSLFSEFTQDELCQLYVYPTLPDVSKCHSYYRVTDHDVLNAKFIRPVKGNVVLPSSKTATEVIRVEKPLAEQHKNTPVMRFVRDLIWKYSRWNSKSLRQWLAQENPTCIFLAPGIQKFIYDIAIKISSENNIPIITYICDDFYFLQRRKISDKFFQYFFNKKMKSLMYRTVHLITICDELREQYESTFQVTALTLMTGTGIDIMPNINVSDEVTSIVYMGNISLNRYQSIVSVGKALKEINEKSGTNYELHLYTSEHDEQRLSAVSAISTIKLMGFVSGEKYGKILTQADVLLHVEAFDKESTDRVKSSISTKIADSLASGVCLIAYGPSNIASMSYLQSTGGAFTITETDNLIDKLEEILTNKTLRTQYATQGLGNARLYHDARKNSQILYEICREE